MTERARSGIPWAHEFALRLGILVALATLVLLYCIGCDPVPPMAFTPLPEPTWTATPTLSSDLSFVRWGLETIPQIEIIADASQAIADLFENPVGGVAAWTALFAAQVVRMREADAILRGIVPPEGCEEAHAMLLSSTGDSLLGAQYLLKGIQQQDPGLAEQGVEYTTSAVAKMRRFHLMVETMTP